MAIGGVRPVELGAFNSARIVKCPEVKIIFGHFMYCIEGVMINFFKQIFIAICAIIPFISIYLNFYDEGMASTPERRVIVFISISIAIIFMHMARMDYQLQKLKFEASSRKGLDEATLKQLLLDCKTPEDVERLCFLMRIL